MSEQQNEFKGWAKVEVMGHQSHVGFVTTEVYGQTVLFRIDQPELPESEETLTHSEWVGEQYCKPGSVIKRGRVAAVSVLLGSGSIYRIIPCDEASALAAIRGNERRALMVVKLAEAPAIEAPRGIEDDFREELEENEEDEELV